MAKKSNELATIEANNELATTAKTWADDGWDIAPQVVSMDEGQELVGKLLGQGQPVEAKDESTGEMKELPTWLFEVGQVKLSLISAHQLDKDLPALVGKMVRVCKLEQKQVGSRRVNRFVIGSKEV